ncbi:MAG: hypothetical protein IJM57_02530 [Lachnospiraceae bacterium]|nr:hypothetical protein [Lachnospiraceae bacterium]
MIVSFWFSHYREETAQILALVSGMCCRLFPCSIVAAENYLHARNLGFHLLGERYDSVRRALNPNSESLYQPGETYARYVAEEMQKNSRTGSLIDADPKGLWFLPMDQSRQADPYRYAMKAVFEDVAYEMEELFGNVFLNLESNGNSTTMTMLDRSDIVVTCLPATESAFSEFYENYRSLAGKCFLVFYGTRDAPGRVLGSIKRLLPKHALRCCYLRYTDALIRYLDVGKGIDYLDRFDGIVANPAPEQERVSEETGRYEGMRNLEESEEDSYRRWKREYGEKFAEELLAITKERQKGLAPRKERQREERTIQSIRYVSEWLMKSQYPDAGGDCDLIAQRMLRRQILPGIVHEWDMMKKDALSQVKLPAETEFRGKP